VPSAFVRKYTLQVDRKRMLLENAKGKPWLVCLAKHAFFTGWAEFSTVNNLTIAIILFFSFVEEAKFVVHAFGKSGVFIGNAFVSLLNKLVQQLKACSKR
jgi:hypothetical protein